MTHRRGVCGSASTRCTLPLTTKSNAMLSSSAWANCSVTAGGCTSGRLDREHGNDRAFSTAYSQEIRADLAMEATRRWHRAAAAEAARYHVENSTECTSTLKARV